MPLALAISTWPMNPSPSRSSTIPRRPVRLLRPVPPQRGPIRPPHRQAEPTVSALVRRATPDDVPEHARMRAALWPDEDHDELASELPSMLADPNQVAFVAERDDAGRRLCGFAEAAIRPYANSNDEAPCAFLEGWWVDEDVRRTGVGRALVAAVEDWARAQGFTELGSDALLDNSTSHAAHRALGFEERERVIYFRKFL
jgi:aminoglycoside 6'-N-acetyltransferase I